MINRYIKKVKRYLTDIGMFRFVSDEAFIRKKYKKIYNKDINLKNPQTFNEKMNWLKLYDHKDIYTTMVDKYEAKKYVSNIIGEEYIVPTLGVWDSFDDIDFNSLPEQFVLKCTHDSGGILLCKNKSSFDKKSARFRFNMIMKRNYYYRNREWPYKNVKPRIIAEKFLTDGINESLKDYKFFCFNGEPRMMYVSVGLENHETASMSFYDMDFNLTDCKRKDFKRLDYSIEKPILFEEMKELSRKLSNGVPHLRVDWYEVNGKLYFGELTFSTCGGFIPFEDEYWDDKFGKMLDLERIES